MRKLVFKIGDTVQVIRLGATSNAKIEANNKRKIVQTYTFSRKQFELIATDTNEGMKMFFSNADTNCLDCPYNVFGKCYTHKFNQYVGFVSMLKSIAKEFPTFENIPEYTEEIKIEAINMSRENYVRFGTYGEPSVHPSGLIENMVEVSDTYTGYTHQWNKTSLGDYFMASTHSKAEEIIARAKGYRSFMAVDKLVEGTVNCPASKEGGNKSTCSKCGLCSGIKGKGNKSISILNH